MERTSSDLESTEIRRQKVECLVALYGLRRVISHGGGNVPDEFRARFNSEINKVVARWADDSEAMKNFRDYAAEKTPDRLVTLLRRLGASTKLPINMLGDADVRGVIYSRIGYSNSRSG